MSTTPPTQPIYSLLPAIYRSRDILQGSQLSAFYEVLESQYGIVRDNLMQLYADQFIETCAPWVIPYIGDLIGYQSVKGMSAASRIIRDGGMIICAAECRDGFPDHGSYREVLQSAATPQALLDDINSRPFTVPDQWQVQIQAQIQVRSRVVMHTSYLSDTDLAEAHLSQTPDISAAIEEEVRRIGPEARICVLPEGPQTIPYLETARTLPRVNGTAARRAAPSSAPPTGTG